MDQITKLDVEVDKTNEQLLKANNQLKKIVDEVWFNLLYKSKVQETK